MKLVEIKNSLAKLYYSPEEFPLALSDFLTIDDKNQKIISQVVSIESTNKDNTNCAVLKFSLDLQNDKKHSPYGGYVPSLDAQIKMTERETIDEIFSNKQNSFYIGQLTNSSKLPLKINSKLLDSFLYVQSDKETDAQNLKTKFFENFNSKLQKTLVLDFDEINEYENATILELGKEFKLPINNEVLNYIYEYDLTGLTIEQKTIVQDIILEIQDYIETLENKFIPLNTLLSVVNDIYESDKSVGVILFRNKLIKYSQSGIFASDEKEFLSINETVESNPLTVLRLNKANSNWKKEAFDFVINNLKTNIYLVFEANEEITDKELLNKVYKNKQFRPIVFSKYDFEYASQLKSFAKNLVLFKPEQQQKAFATYNSFLMKLSDSEFIVSGEATFFTPLILKPKEGVFGEVEEEVVEIPVELEHSTVEDSMESAEIPENIETLELNETDAPLAIEQLEENELSNDLKDIFEESLEQEIAKDVDQMFYVDSSAKETEELFETEDTEEISYEEILSDDDLDLLDDLNSEDDEIQENEPQKEDQSFSISAKLQQEEDFSELSGLEDDDEIKDIGQLEELSEISPLETFEDDFETNEQETLEITQQVISSIQIESLQESFKENDGFGKNESMSGIPIYKTELDNNIAADDKIKIAEGNIVYHEKYGRGVVEQLISYGKKTLCSIQFDNVGRRLLDPSLADLKQM